MPENFKIIKNKFKDYPNVNVLNIALSDKPGNVVFNFVPEFPAYSGFKVRDYPSENVKTQKIDVKTEKLDNLIPDSQIIDFIKIDVEGAEYLVLQGAKETIRRSKPYVVFEFGLGASNYYGTDASAMFDFFDNELDYRIFLIDKFLKNKPPLSKLDFERQYNERINYYFVAAPKKRA